MKKSSQYPSQFLQVKECFSKSPRDTGTTNKAYFGRVCVYEELLLRLHFVLISICFIGFGQYFSDNAISIKIFFMLSKKEKKNYYQCKKILGNTLFWPAFSPLSICSTLTWLLFWHHSSGSQSIFFITFPSAFLCQDSLQNSAKIVRYLQKPKLILV